MNLLHHVALFTFIIAVVVFVPKELPSLPLLLFMFVYSDAYSAFLHATLDHEACLTIGPLATAAEGFQMHHEYPIASTQGVGLYRLICNTIFIQWVVSTCGIIFSGRSALAVRILILKLIITAYWSQVAHYWSHVPSNRRPLLIDVLQRCHLLLPPDHHGRHHKPPYSKCYGIINGLSNPFLNPILQDMRFPVLFPIFLLLTLFDIGIIERLFSIPILVQYS